MAYFCLADMTLSTKLQRQQACVYFKLLLSLELVKALTNLTYNIIVFVIKNIQRQGHLFLVQVVTNLCTLGLHWCGADRNTGNNSGTHFTSAMYQTTLQMQSLPFVRLQSSSGVLRASLTLRELARLLTSALYNHNSTALKSCLPVLLICQQHP